MDGLSFARLDHTVHLWLSDSAIYLFIQGAALLSTETMFHSSSTWSSIIMKCTSPLRWCLCSPPVSAPFCSSSPEARQSGSLPLAAPGRLVPPPGLESAWRGDATFHEADRFMGILILPPTAFDQFHCILSFTLDDVLFGRASAWPLTAVQSSSYQTEWCGVCWAGALGLWLEGRQFNSQGYCWALQQGTYLPVAPGTDWPSVHSKMYITLEKKQLINEYKMTMMKSVFTGYMYHKYVSYWQGDWFIFSILMGWEAHL